MKNIKKILHFAQKYVLAPCSLFLVLCSLFLTTSCSKNKDANQLYKTQKSHVIPLSNALDNLNSLLDFINKGDSKSYQRREIATISILGKIQKTQNGMQKISTNSADTLLYYVEFEDNQGCAILSADDRISEPVLAITENGALFDEQTFILYDSRKIYDDPNLEGFQIYNEEEDDWYVSDIGETIGIIPLQEIMYYAIKERDTDGGGTTGGSNGNNNGNSGTTYTYSWTDWYDFENIPIKLTTNWGQSLPYNAKCPIMMSPMSLANDASLGYPYGGRCPAGCVAVAVAQIMAYHQYPNNPQTWDINNNNGDFWNTSYNFSWSSISNENKASLLRSIGKKCKMLYASEYDFALPKNAAKCLKYYGYNDAERDYIGNDFEDNDTDELPAIINMLQNDCPVFIAACSNGNVFAGHAWVIDGYLHRKKDKIRHGGGQDIVVSTDNQKLLHCNFGWKGSCNGYYISGIFNACNGPVIGGGGTDDCYDNYNFNFYIINYSKPN